MDLFRRLEEINRRPACFARYTAADLWTDEYTSARMLSFHLDGAVDISSRKTVFIERSVAWMIARFGLGAGKAVADFGCGPGLYTTRLAASGAAVTGIDFSRRSIEYARRSAQEQGVAVNHILANYLEYESDDRFDLIILVMGDYCALSPEQRRSLLEKFRRHLRPGGALSFDVYSLTAFTAREETATYGFRLLNGFWSPDPYFGFLNTFKYEPERVVLDHYTIVEATRTREIFNWLQYFDRAALRAEIEGAGLAVEEFLGNLAGDAFDSAAPEFAVVARKTA